MAGYTKVIVADLKAQDGKFVANSQVKNWENYFLWNLAPMKTALLFSFFTDVLIAIRVILTGRSLKKTVKIFLDPKCNLLAWSNRLLLFFSLKKLWPRLYTSRLCDHFHLLSFLHITFFALVFHIWKIRHRLTLRPFSPLTNRGRPPSAIMTHCALSRQCYTHCSRWFVFLYS